MQEKEQKQDMEQQEASAPQTPKDDMPSEEAMSGSPKQSGGSGALISLVVVVLVIVLGAWYIFTDRVSETQPADTPASEAAFEAEVSEIETVSEDDSLSAIEADLNATDLESLDAELQALDSELGQ